MALVLLVREHHAKVCPSKAWSKLRFLCSETIHDSNEEKRRDVATPLTTRANKIIQNEDPAAAIDRIILGMANAVKCKRRNQKDAPRCRRAWLPYSTQKRRHPGTTARGHFSSASGDRQRERSLPFLRPILSTRDATTVPKMAELT